MSDLHVDVIVGPYPPGMADYDRLARPERARLIEEELPRFLIVVRAFDPRQLVEEP